MSHENPGTGQLKGVMKEESKDAHVLEDGLTLAEVNEPSTMTVIEVTRENTNTLINRTSSNTEVVRKHSDSRVLSHAVEYIDDKEFKFNRSGLSSEEAKKLLEKHGLNVLPEKVVPKWYIFVQQLWQPMPIMIWIAIIIEAGIQNFIDMGILLFIQFANAFQFEL